MVLICFVIDMELPFTNVVSMLLIAIARTVINRF